MCVRALNAACAFADTTMPYNAGSMALQRLSLCCGHAVACAPNAAKKACKNCTCGRAEAEAEGKPAAPVKLTQDMLDNPKTNCGSVSTLLCHAQRQMSNCATFGMGSAGNAEEPFPI